MRLTISIALALLLNWNQAIAQSYAPDPDIVKEVNETLWAPFVKAYEEKDAKAFIALHTKDVMRVGPEQIRIGEEYRGSVDKGFHKNPGRKQTIDIAMEHRVYNGEHGYEVGFYRIRYYKGEEISQTHYARFHVRLRKEDGKWKIAQDWDINQINDEPITEKDFAKAELLKMRIVW